MNDQIRVYRLGPPRSVALPITWLLITGALVGFGWSEGGDAAEGLYLTALAVTVIMLPFLFVLRWCRLELDSDGIRQFEFGFIIRSTWSNISELSLTPGREGLYLTEPGTNSRLLYLAQYFQPFIAGQLTGGDSDALANGRFIDLNPFMRHWRRGTLRDDIRKWAPTLLDGSTQ